ncbi:ATP-binding protein [Derxia gummosa]|uniref:histidine kinase n=1 Tax=Derxia gummosa DSM 723 TaxID=1121388 RepID=A0A8B6XB15_9BURK|nr:ATP-binding protein [Derxia gummosa]
MSAPPLARPTAPDAQSRARAAGPALALFFLVFGISLLALRQAHVTGALVPTLLPEAFVLGALLRRAHDGRGPLLAAGLAAIGLAQVAASLAGLLPLALALAWALAQAITIGLASHVFALLGVDARNASDPKRRIAAFIIVGGPCAVPGAVIAGIAAGVIWKIDGWAAAQLWWASDALLITTLVPLAISLSRVQVARLFGRATGDGRGGAREGGLELVFALIVVVAIAAIATSHAPHWLMIVEIPLGIAALRFSVLATCVLTLAIQTTVFAAFGGSPFGAERHDAFLYLAMTLAVVSLPPLAIAYLFAGMRHKHRHLAESEERFRGAMHDSPIGMALVGLDGRAIEVNPALCRMLDRPRVALLARPLDAVQPRDVPRLRARLRRLLRRVTRGPVQPRAGSAPADPRDPLVEGGTRATVPTGEFEIRLRRRDGSLLPAAIAASLVRGSDGRPLHFVLQAYDLTQAKAAEAALRDSWWRLERVFQGSDDSYWDLDIASGRIFCGDSLLTSLGHPPGLAFDLAALLALTHPDDLPALRAALLEHVEGRSARLAVEHRMRGADGSWRWVFLRGRAYDRDADGRATGIAGIHTDTTERRLLNDSLLEHTRALAEARKLAQARSNFLANMSHEIRTPLAAVIGNTQLALRSVPFGVEDGVRPYLERIEKSGALLLALVNDVLDLSKIEENRLSLERIEFELGDPVDQVVEIAADRASASHIALIVDEDPALPRRVIGDPLRLTQVLLNLVTNAVKFTERGSVTVRLRRAGPEGGLVAEVEDTGIGIAPEHLARLFSPFEQGDGSLTRRFGGTGLGLAISQRLVGLMGGRIEVRSEIGRGSCFTVRLPGLTEVPPPHTPEPPRRRVLLAALPPANVAPVSRWLGARGLEVLTLDEAELAAPGDAAAPTSGTGGRASTGILTALLSPAGPGHARAPRPRRDDLVIAPAGLARDRLEALARQCVAAGAELVLLVASGAVAPALAGLPFAARTLATPLRARHVHSLLARHEAETRSTPETPLLAGLHLLLAEDNPLNRDMVGEMLGRAGATLDFAENGQEAVERIEGDGGRYAAVLMDIQMPVLDGIEAARRIRALQPRLPIIALTAHALADERRRAQEAGMVAYLTKPVDFALLERAVADFAGLGKPGSRPAGLITRPPAYADMPVITSLLQGAVAARLDADAGLRLVGGMRDLYARVLHGFVQAYAGGLPLTPESGAADVARAVHTLKGLSAQIGATRLHRACLAWEATWRESTRGVVPMTLPPDALPPNGLLLSELRAVVAEAQAWLTAEAAPGAEMAH